MKSKFSLVVISLLARLWWTVEVSRLALLQVRPLTAQHRPFQHENGLKSCHWVFSRNKLHCVSVDERHAQISVIISPKIEFN